MLLKVEFSLVYFNKIKPQKYDGKYILLSSVIDPYIPLELKFQKFIKS